MIKRPYLEVKISLSFSKNRDVLFELNFGIPPVLVFQLEVYYKIDRLLIALTAQQKGTTAR